MIPICILVMEDEDDCAFMTHLYKTYHRLMYSEIRKIVTDSWVVDDVMQTTLENLMKKVADLRIKDRSRLVNYIISACKLNALNYLRNTTRRTIFSFDDDWDAEDPEQNLQTIELRLVEAEEREHLARVWPELDERSRLLLEGRYILEKSPEELARDLGIKPASVRMALTRARKAAYQLMQQQD